MLFRRIKRITACFGLFAIIACSVFVPAFAATDAVGFEPHFVQSDTLHFDCGILPAVGYDCYSYYLPVGRYLISFEDIPADVESNLEREYGFELCDVVYIVKGTMNVINSSSPIMLVVTESMVNDDNAPGGIAGICEVIVNSASQPLVVDASAENSVVGSILGIWSSILGWFASAFTKITPLFYSSGSGLTFIGFLAVAGVAVSVAFLLVIMLKRWLRFGS